MDHTNDPTRLTFVPTPKDTQFPIQNLPWGIVSPRAGGEPRAATRIGDQVVDLSVLEAEGLFDGEHLRGRRVFSQPTLNDFMALGKPAWTEARQRISDLLWVENTRLQDDEALRARAILPLESVRMHMPARIGDYTDFYSSREHATNVGTMFRGADNALMPNWLHLPVAYHGRASSVVLSGVDVKRPMGQTKADDADRPSFGPSRLLDFELEVGCFVAGGNALGEPIPVEEALDQVFGLVLVNDWSARDIQKWEYVPLGPFLAKNFCTSISPWVISLDALAPFRCAGPPQQPTPLPYLEIHGEQTFDIDLQVAIQSEAMRQSHGLKEPHPVCRTNFKNLYWNMAQQIAHHTVTGCNLKPGDLLASGTISGATPDSRGSMLEITWRGTMPLRLPNGDERRFLEDGDRVIMTGRCEGAGYTIGFGEVAATVLPAG